MNSTSRAPDLHCGDLARTPGTHDASIVASVVWVQGRRRR